MAKKRIPAGSTNISVYLYVESTASPGSGLTGLVYNTSSLRAYYTRPLGSATQITLATQTVTGAHSDGGFVEVDATNSPGLYRLDLPDAVCAVGVDSVVVQIGGAINMPEIALEIQLDDMSEPSAVPAFGVAMPRMMAWLFSLSKNKITQTDDTQTLRNAADNADIATATVSDDGTTGTRGAWS